MSQIKTKQQLNPFQGPLSREAQSVGKTYGERRLKQAGLAPKATLTQRPMDKFSHQAGRGGVADFDPKATYRAARRFSDGAPYRPAAINRIQEGTAPQASRTGPPSTDAILHFLERIIATPQLHSAQAIRRASFQGNPVRPKKAGV